jgi:hypothetical protein
MIGYLIPTRSHNLDLIIEPPFDFLNHDIIDVALPRVKRIVISVLLYFD